MKLITYFQHLRLRNRIVAYVDGLLSGKHREAVERHLETCQFCQKFISDSSLVRQVVDSATPPARCPDQEMIERIYDAIGSGGDSARHAQHSKSVFYRDTTWRKVVSIAAVVTVLSGIYFVFDGKVSSLQIADHTVETASVFDFGYYVDLVKNEQDPEAFYQRYQARAIDPQSPACCYFMSAELVELFQKKFNLECMRVLKTESNECIEVTCAINQKPVKIFRQARGSSWNLGNYLLSRGKIAGTECLFLEDPDFSVISWEGDYYQYLIIGDIRSSEVSQVIEILK